MNKTSFVFLTALFLVINYTSVHSEEVQGKLSLESQSKELVEGDLVKGRLTIWPIEDADVDFFRKYQMQDFMEGLKLIEIESLKPSENNADVIELVGSFFVKGTQLTNKMNLSYHNLNFVVSSERYNVIKLKDKKSNFEILEQSVQKKNKVWLYSSVLFILAIVLVLFHKKILSKLSDIRNIEKSKKKKKYDDIFTKAIVREDFEMIYLKRSEWLGLLIEVTPSHENFFNILNSHQFKKSWDNDELDEVRISFDYIRGSFKK